MFDMTILLIAFVAVVCLAIAFFGISGNGDGTSPLLAGISTVKKFYEKRLKKNKGNGAAVLYIHIFYENLQIMIDTKELSVIREQVEAEVLQLCRYGHGEAAQVDGNNYVVAVDLPQYEIEDFCKGFLSADKKSYKMLEAFVGVYTASDEDTEFLKAAGYAKKASRVAKSTGDKYLLADRENMLMIVKSDNIERNIEQLIDNNDFYQMFQPMFDALTGKIIGCEALTRLRDEDVDDILPNMFLNAIKKEQLYGKFDMYVFQKCCQWAADRRSEHLAVTCKFAQSTLAGETAADDIKRIAQEAGIANDMLMIEVAQDTLDQHSDVFESNIAQLKRAGFRLCVDNFGRGYTSLGDITKISPDAIKLDRSLIHNAHGGAGRIIFDNVVKLAKELHAKVICGGIENEEQEEIAKTAGCDALQGFYLSRPLDETRFDEFWREHADTLHTVKLLTPDEIEKLCATVMDEQEELEEPESPLTEPMKMPIVMEDTEQTVAAELQFDDSTVEKKKRGRFFSGRGKS